jgi:hypothetical protein
MFADMTQQHERDDRVPHRVQVAEEEDRRHCAGQPAQDKQILDPRPPDGLGAERREPSIVDVDARERLPEEKQQRDADRRGDQPASSEHVRA